jgi:hypothetical protein
MIDELREKVITYLDEWALLSEQRQNKAFFANLKPTAVGWKATDRDELMKQLAEVRDLCDQIHFGWVNERWLITLHFKELLLPGNITVLKLMERRPGSNDPVGLDHVDFYAGGGNVKTALKNETDLRYEEEKNGAHCKWISVWFDGGEAKLRNDTVLKVCADEMLEFEEKIIAA